MKLKLADKITIIVASFMVVAIIITVVISFTRLINAYIIADKKLSVEKSYISCKIVEFMDDEGFKHTDQTVDGQDIFEGKKGKIIVEIIEK